MLYRRTNIAGATYFFTVNLAERLNDLLVNRIDDLRTSVCRVQKLHPFAIPAWVVMKKHAGLIREHA